MGILGLVFIIIILIYILELEKKNCDCSKHWMRDFIKYVSIIMLIITTIILFIPNGKELCKKNDVKLICIPELFTYIKIKDLLDFLKQEFAKNNISFD